MPGHLAGCVRGGCGSPRSARTTASTHRTGSTSSVLETELCRIGSVVSGQRRLTCHPIRSGGSSARATRTGGVGSDPDPIAEGLKALGSRNTSFGSRCGVPDSSWFGRHTFSVVIQRALYFGPGPGVRVPRHTSVPSNCRGDGGWVRPAAAGVHQTGRRGGRGCSGPGSTAGGGQRKVREVLPIGATLPRKYVLTAVL